MMTATTTKIDFHVHLTPPEIIKNTAYYTEKEPYFALLSAGKANKFATAEDVIAQLDDAGFDKAVVFGFAFNDIARCRMVNDYVIDAVRRYPERLSGFCVVPPNDRACEKEIARCHDAGLSGIGELFPTGQRFDLRDNAATGALCHAALERRMPVLLHANEAVGHDYPGKTKTSLHEIERFVRANPLLDIILAHWGGGILFYEMMQEIKTHFTRVYYDTAASPFLYDERIYTAAARIAGAEKILFGSDYPLIPIKRYLAGIKKSGLASCEAALVLGANAARLLPGS